jgi:hypothetical protein
MNSQRRSPPARRLKSLRETLEYRNDQVVYKFMERYRLTLREARDIFSEARKWMWLCARAERVPSAPKHLTLIGLQQMGIVDEMWHTFVLFTPIYEAFCHRYLGFFLHHMPSTRESHQREEALRRADPEGYEQRTLARLREELAFVGQELGPATLRKWFTTYGRKYTPEHMDRLRLPHMAIARTAQARKR